MSSGGSGVWLGEEEAGKWFRLHQCKGEVIGGWVVCGEV